MLKFNQGHIGNISIMSAKSSNIIKGSFFFDPEDKIYRDHFPSNPVVPGCLIVHAFLDASAAIRKKNIISINNFKFTKFISPGEYSFTIDSQPERLVCRLYENEKAVVSGVIAL